MLYDIFIVLHINTKMSAGVQNIEKHLKLNPVSLYNVQSQVEIVNFQSQELV